MFDGGQQSDRDGPKHKATDGGGDDAGQRIEERDGVLKRRQQKWASELPLADPR